MIIYHFSNDFNDIIIILNLYLFNSFIFYQFKTLVLKQIMEYIVKHLVIIIQTKTYLLFAEEFSENDYDSFNFKHF